jgi:hypothetical protein
MKLGYKAKMSENVGIVGKWWWKVTWKMDDPLKIKIFLWMALGNKILTWDNGQK